MRRRVAVSLIMAIALTGLVLPTSGIWADSPKPVPPKVHSMPLDDIDQVPGAPRPGKDQRVVALTDERSVPDYSLLGVSWLGQAAEDMVVLVRTRNDGVWSGWTELHADSDDRPDDETIKARKSRVRNGTAPYYAGQSDGVQVLVTAPKGPKPRDLRLDLVDPGRSGHDDEVGDDPAGAAHGMPDRPQLISRLQWGADESLMTWAPEYSPTLQAGFVHHTAGANGYTRDEVPGLIRGIYAYHAQTLGWGDIGYNVLVDRFGRIFEGRYGGVDRTVVGGHTGGYNTNSFGVAAIGTFTSTAPATGMVDAMTDVLAWKLDPYGGDPLGSTVLNGKTFGVIAGHRDAKATECPGELLYDKLSAMRNDAAELVSADEQVFTGDWNGDGIDTAGKFDDGYWLLRDSDEDPASAIKFRLGRAGDIPVVGDWNGDRKTDVGVFRSGQWYLKMGAPGGPGTLTFRFGGPSDVPVTGDWDGDGRTEPGVFRSGEWLLQDTIGDEGAADQRFTFGQAGDKPVFGDWNGDGKQTPAVLRGSTWYLRHELGVPALDTSFSYGQSGDRPVSGHWDADTADEIGVVREMTWLLRNHASAGTPDRTFRM